VGEADLMQARRPAIGFQLLAVAGLCVGALFASGWAQLYCFYARGWADRTQSLRLHFDEQDGHNVADAFWPNNNLENYIFRPAITLLWVVAVGIYIFWVRRSKSGLALTILPLALFGYFSWNQLLYAYPVCNSF
jgi:hypothetical protein